MTIVHETSPNLSIAFVKLLVKLLQLRNARHHVL
jgi:hypothetical protein